eukprot:UN02355
MGSGDEICADYSRGSIILKENLPKHINFIIHTILTALWH